MIARPLELASRLRPEPRNFDWLFFVNAGLLVLFFTIYFSPFVLAPGLSVDLPQLPGARAGGAQPTHYISVPRPGVIFVDEGPVTLKQLQDWLAAKAATTPHPTLLVRASATVSWGELTDITSVAHAAGFPNVVVAAQEAAGKGR